MTSFFFPYTRFYHFSRDVVFTKYRENRFLSDARVLSLESKGHVTEEYLFFLFFFGKMATYTPCNAHSLPDVGNADLSSIFTFFFADFFPIRALCTRIPCARRRRYREVGVYACARAYAYLDVSNKPQRVILFSLKFALLSSLFPRVRVHCYSFYYNNGDLFNVVCQQSHAISHSLAVPSLIYTIIMNTFSEFRMSVNIIYHYYTYNSG